MSDTCSYSDVILDKPHSLTSAISAAAFSLSLSVTSLSNYMPDVDVFSISECLKVIYEKISYGQSALISETSSFYELKERIQQIKELEKNWNGYQADPIPSSVIKSAVNLLDKLARYSDQISIFPTAAKSIQFEASFGDDSYIEIEIFDKRISLYSECNGVDSEDNCSDIQEAARRFIEIHV